MNLRLSILLVAVLLIFGGTVLVLQLRDSKSPPDNRPWLYQINDSSIVHIGVSHQGETVNFDRKPGTRNWYIRGDPEIPVFLEKWAGMPLLFSGPKVSRSLNDTIDNPSSFGLEPPVTRATVTDLGGNTYEFHLGDLTPDTEFQYARLVGDSTLFTVPAAWSRVVNRLATAPPYLRLYQLEDDAIQFIEVTYEDRVAQFAKTRESGEWFILDEAGELDVPVFLEKWGATEVLLSGPRVDRLVLDLLEKPEEYGLEPPRAKIRVGHSEGKFVEFHLGDTTEDGEYQYARVLGQKPLFAMPQDQAQGIIDLALEPPYPPEA